MPEYIKEKWKDDFPDRAGQEVRPQEAIDNTLDYDALFPQYLSEDPVVYNQQNKTISQLVSNDARLYERISATAADINAHLTDANAHQTGIAGNAATSTKLQTGRNIHGVFFDGTKDITLPDFRGCGEKVSGQSGMVPAPSSGKIHTVLHGSGNWGKVTYADMDEEAVQKIQACPFPVNSIYISTVGKSPSYYWPGTTWIAFAMGRCLIGAGTADSGTVYTAGEKLGEEKHRIQPVEMPIHSHTGTTSVAGNHSHNRGNMEISGSFGGDDALRGQQGLPAPAGAFYPGGLAHYDADSEYNSDEDGVVIEFRASRTWTGNTSTNGEHTHTFTTASAGGGEAHNNLQPSIVVYIFRRTG